MKHPLTIVCAAVAAAALHCGPVQGAESADIQVLSATVRDQAIAGAEVLLQENGHASLHGTTDALGRFDGVPDGFSADDASAVLIVRKPGYSTLVARCPCRHLSYAISPVMTVLDGLRVVLNWSAIPPDLDGHLVYGSEHIFYVNRTGSGAQLDVDDRDGFGPETITINDRQPGQRYVYAVHDYSDRDSRGGTALAHSGAQVRVYVGRTLVRSFHVDPSARGNLWTVFAITPDGDFQDIDEYSDLQAPSQLPAALGVAMNPAQPAHAIPQDLRARAQALDHQGEAAYRRRELDAAVRDFLGAVDLDPDYGQAYANLGLIFGKTGREAEALWADRRALALAGGADAARVRAGSYYNIGRIYESRGQWNEALDNYRNAERQRHDQVYLDAIDRVGAKLQPMPAR